MRKVGFVALTVAFLLFLSVLPVTSTTWQPHVNVTNDSQSQYGVSLFVDSDGYAHIAWSNTSTFIGIAGLTGYIFYSNNTGGSFGTPVLIPAPVNGSWGASLAVDALGNVHIAFFGGNVTGTGGGGTQTPFTDVYYSTTKGSVDGSFQTIKLTDYSAPGGTTSLYPDLALDSNGYAHIVWIEEVGDIRYGNNTDGAFGNEKATNENGSPIFFNPSLALDNSDKPHVVCWATDSHDFELFYTTKGAVGAAWLTPMNVTNDPTSATERIDDQYPDISIDDSEIIHIAWQRSFFTAPGSLVLSVPLIPMNTWTLDSSHIFYTNGTINGFPTKTQVSSGGSIHISPSLSLDSNDDAHIVWTNRTAWPYSVIYSNNTGGSFGTAEDLSVAHGHHYGSSVFIDNETYIHVAFAGYATASGPLDVFYLKSGEPVTPVVSEFIGHLLPLLILASFATLIIGIRYAKKKTLN